MADGPVAGSISWIDLTVADADSVRDFYSSVVGFGYDAMDMGGYSDYSMKKPDGKVVAGICHARGSNAALPPTWLPYFSVASVSASVAACTAAGGEVIAGPTEMGGGSSYCVIKDPAGAHCALMGPT